MIIVKNTKIVGIELGDIPILNRYEGILFAPVLISREYFNTGKPAYHKIPAYCEIPEYH